GFQWDVAAPRRPPRPPRPPGGLPPGAWPEVVLSHPVTASAHARIITDRILTVCCSFMSRTQHDAVSEWSLSAPTSRCPTQPLGAGLLRARRNQMPAAHNRRRIVTDWPRHIPLRPPASEAQPS